jgi:hypothetical protein
MVGASGFDYSLKEEQIQGGIMVGASGFDYSLKEEQIQGE